MPFKIPALCERRLNPVAVLLLRSFCFVCLFHYPDGTLIPSIQFLAAQSPNPDIIQVAQRKERTKRSQMHLNEQRPAAQTA